MSDIETLRALAVGSALAIGLCIVAIFAMVIINNEWDRAVGRFNRRVIRLFRQPFYRRRHRHSHQWSRGEFKAYEDGKLVRVRRYRNGRIVYSSYQHDPRHKEKKS